VTALLNPGYLLEPGLGDRTVLLVRNKLSHVKVWSGQSGGVGRIGPDYTETDVLALAIQLGLIGFLSRVQISVQLCPTHIDSASHKIQHIRYTAVLVSLKPMIRVHLELAQSKGRTSFFVYASIALT
jgi:hypothetical protein